MNVNTIVRCAAALTVMLHAVVALAVDPGSQSSLLDGILARGHVLVGTTGDYRPFSYWDAEKQSFEGIDIDMARSMGKALGVEVRFVRTSWPDLMKDLDAGKFHIAMGGISVNTERQKKGYFSRPYLSDGKTPIVRCEDKDRFQSLDQIDRPEVRIIVNPGGTNERFVRARIKQAAITVYPDNVTIFDQIASGKADLMITDAIEARLQQKLRPALCALHPDKPFDFSEKAYLLLRDITWKEWVDQWLHQAIASGEYQAIYDKWLK
jgi:cyclohexadienyl dehydratase